MASKHQAAAKRKAKKKPYKGKYPGPDKYKGKPPPKKKPAAKKAAPKPAPKPAAKPATPVNPNLGTGVGTTTDSNGNLKLQTNYEIEQMVLQANQEQQEATEEANALEGESLIGYSEGKRSALNNDVQNRTAAAGRMAARGMHGTAAAASSANVKRAYADQLNSVNLKRNQEHASSQNMITAAASRRKMRESEIALARKNYTDEQSKNNPTVGSTPVNSGVTAPKATPVATRPKPPAKKAPAKKPAKKKSYKGKRPGPG